MRDDDSKAPSRPTTATTATGSAAASMPAGRRGMLQALAAGTGLLWLHGGARARESANAAAAAASAAPVDPVRPGQPLVMPRDHGAHPASAIEWWYVTGWLGSGPQAPSHGFQVTFFRRRTGLADKLPGRFAARHVLLGHAALTDLAAGTHRHAQRIARWSEDGQATPSEIERVPARRDRATLHDADVAIGRWHLTRSGPSDATTSQAQVDATTWRAQVDDGDWTLALTMTRTQPVLLQGNAGYSRKGRGEGAASHYYSEPQLAVSATLAVGGRARSLSGRGWLDHEWSDALMSPDAVGWDWAGINLDDGGALTVFVLRRADGSASWAGGSYRAAAAAPVRPFAEHEVRLTPGRTWRSPATGAVYPVQWTIDCPAGRFTLRSQLDAQEMDARSTTGTVYWEGLSSLHDAGGTRVGWGYLEMTGYAGRLRW